MDVKMKLRSYLPAFRYAITCADRLDAIRGTLIKSPKMDGMPRSQSVGGLEIIAAAIDAEEKRLTKARTKALAILDEIEDMIDSLDDYDAKKVMRLHYIDGLTWEQVATASHWSESTVRRIHGRALEELRRRP